MRLTQTLIDKLISLRNGNSLPFSQLTGDWVDDLIRDGVLVSVSRGTRKSLFVPDSELFCATLSSVDERLGDLEKIRDVLSLETQNRADLAIETGNSKLVSVRSCPGFPVNSYDSIECELNAKKFIVNPQVGSFIFVTDWKEFIIPADVVIIGVENMENFRSIRQTRQLFRSIEERGRILFVSRYPQSSDLRSWLQKIPNQYIHFGDFDLAGINIFLTEFYKYLGDKSSYFIPSDIEQRLISGSFKRYNDQYQRFKNISCDIPEIKHLIDLIHRYHRCYDQEGYIGYL